MPYLRRDDAVDTSSRLGGVAVSMLVLDPRDASSNPAEAMDF
jgi:hypothetical protein